MARVKQIKLEVGSSVSTIEVGDLCASDFQNIQRPKASIKSCQACLNAILDAILGQEESDDEES